MKKFLLWPQLRCSGFSLLEVSIVLLLILLIATLTGMHTSFLDRAMVRSELEQLYNTCTYLQRSAMAHNKPEVLIFDVVHNQYHYHETTHTLAQRVQFGATPIIKGPPSAPHRPIVHPITFPESRITFHPDGIIEPGTVYLTNEKKQHTYALSCAVSQVSYLRKYQYTDRWIAL